MLAADRDGNVLWVSDALASLWGGGRSFKGTPWLGELVEAEDPEHLLLSLDRAGRVGNEPVVLRGRETSVRATVSAAELPEGGPHCFTVAIFRVEQPERHALQRNLGFTRAVLDSAPEGVVVIDGSRFVTYANPAMAKMTGYAVEEIVDRPLAMFLPSHVDHDRIAQALTDAPETTHGIELDVSRRDDTPLHVNVSAKLLKLADGTRIGAVAYVRDITEVQRFQRELERKNAELEHTVHAVSHDLRSPLAAMLGFSRLLREDYAEVLDEKGRHFVRRIEEAGRNMETLIHDLLELSRIGATEPLRAPVDPREILQQLGAELKPRLDAAHIDLRLPEHPPLLYCERTRLYQVLSNLVGNAIEHMGTPPKAVIEVSIHDDENHQRVTVQDNGAGVDPSEHERIFQMFHSLTPGGSGTGIGLAIVDKIAESHGGRAWVESLPGQGATFHVTFARH